MSKRPLDPGGTSLGPIDFWSFKEKLRRRLPESLFEVLRQLALRSGSGLRHRLRRMQYIETRATLGSVLRRGPTVAGRLVWRMARKLAACTTWIIRRERRPRFVSAQTGSRGPAQDKPTFYLVQGVNRRTATALLEWMPESTRQETFVLVPNRELLGAVQRLPVATYMLRDLPLIDKQIEIAGCQRGFEFLSDLRQWLGGTRYRNVDLAEIAQIRLHDREKFLRLLGRIIHAALQAGYRHILFAHSDPSEFHSFVLQLGTQRGISTVVLTTLARYKRDLARRRALAEQTQDEGKVDSRTPGRTEKYLKRQIIRRLKQLAGQPAPTAGWFNAALQALYPHAWFEHVIMRRLEASSARPVLVVTEAQPGSIYWRALEPVLEQLARSRCNVLALSSRGTTVAAIRRMGLRACRVPTPVLIDMQEIREKLVQPWTQRLAQLASDQMGQDSDWPGRRRLDIEEKALVERLSDCEAFENYMLRQLRHIDMMTALMQHLRPISLLAMPHSSELTSVAIAVARAHHIPSVSMPSVTVAGHRRSLSDWNVDLIAAYGTQCVEAFTAVGYPRDKMVLTGNAAMDRLLWLKSEQCRQYCARKYEWSFNRKTFLVATSRIDASEDLWLKEMIAYCRQRGDCGVIVKVHPSFGREDYEQIVGPGDEPYFRIVTDPEALHPLIAATDVLVTDYSTVGAEAAIQGKPILVVNLTGKEYPSNNYDRYGIAMGVRGMDQLRPAMGALLDNPETLGALAACRDAFLEMYNWRNDGQASARIRGVLQDPHAYLVQQSREGKYCPTEARATPAAEPQSV